MPFNGSGTFSLTYTWATEAASPPIAISKLDTQEQDIAAGLSNCITRDGQSTITANIPFNGKRITNLGDATADTDALNRRSGDARYLQLSGGTLTGGIAGTTGSFSSTLTVTGAVTFSSTLAVATSITVGGVSVRDAAILSSGTLDPARVPQSAVTQHQGALSIAETQIPNGAILARVGSNETISGTWTFSTRPRSSNAGGFLSHASSANTGGSVTVSTSAASGTPANGDIWIQYS